MCMETFSDVADCSTCPKNIAQYELISVGAGKGILSDDYAFVLKDGYISKVELNRIYDVKESRYLC